MPEKDSNDLTIEGIRDKISQGASLRESGDYELGERELEQAFDLSEKLSDRVLATEAGNQLSIQYRLIAGREGRKGDLVKAERYSTKSLKIYDRLEVQDLLEKDNPIAIRNRAHAFLYAGYVEESIPVLQHSAQVQPNPATQGDEYCHLASAYLAIGNIQRADEALKKGLDLLKNNSGSLIALTYSLMTEATLLARNGNQENATAKLKEALEIAEKNKLAVREEEINFLLSKPAAEINVFEAVSGDLKEIRDLEKEISTNWEKPTKVPKKPVVLLLGGFQGSGKSSVLEKLKDELDLTVISADVIRQMLFNKSYPFSNRFTQIVEATVSSLFRKAMNLGYFAASDSNMTPSKIQAFREFMAEEDFNSYHIVTALLELSPETLRDRVSNRVPVLGRYTGKVNELEASIQKHGQLDKSEYDLVLDGEKLTLDQEVQVIKDRIQALGN